MKYIDLIKKNKWLIMIMITAIFLRFYHLCFQSLWLDEIYTMNVSNPNQSFGKVISEVNAIEGFPYLYFISLKILFSIFGYSDFVARGFSALFGVLSVFTIYKLGKELISKNAGLFAAIILSVNEYNISISQDARPYTFYIFSVILTFLCLAKLIKENNRKNALIYGLSVGLLLNTNFFGFINVLSQILIILFYIFLLPSKRRLIDFKNYMISGIFALLLALPNYQKLINLISIKSFWVPAPKSDSFTIILKTFIGESDMTFFIIIPILIFYFIQLFKSKEKMEFSYENVVKNKQVFSFVIMFVWFFFFFSFLMLKSYGEVSYALPRYFCSISVMFPLVLGISIHYIRENFSKYIALFCIIFFTVTSLYVRNYYSSYHNSQFREVSNFIIENNKNNETVYTSLKYWFDYFLVNKKNKIDTIEKVSLETIFTEMMTDPSKIKPFWYIDAHGRPFILSEASQQFVNNNFYVENNFDGYDAWGKHYILLKDVPTTIDITKFKDLKQNNGDIFLYSIENYENSNNIVKTSGWAYFDKQSSEKTNIGIVFIKDGKAERLITQKVNRPDVTSYFKCDFNADNSGFSSTFDTSKLVSGKYQLAIYIKNSETNKEGLILTDKFLEK